MALAEALGPSQDVPSPGVPSPGVPKRGFGLEGASPTPSPCPQGGECVGMGGGQGSVYKDLHFNGLILEERETELWAGVGKMALAGGAPLWRTPGPPTRAS